MGKIEPYSMQRLAWFSLGAMGLFTVKRMTLKRRFLLHNLLLVGGMLTAGVITYWRLEALSVQVNISQSVYAELRTVGNVAVDAGTVKGLLSDPSANHERIVSHLRYAIGGLDQFIQIGEGYGKASDRGIKDAYVPINQAAASARMRLQEIYDQLHGNPPLSSVDTSLQQQRMDAALDDIDRVASSCIRFISNRQQIASINLARNLVIIGLLSAAAVLAALLLSVSQYRLVMAPLQWLRSGVQQVAQTQFLYQLDPSNMGKSVEFHDLASEFNRMAAELDGFYRRLEEQVRTKSMELVRSERLASVGFLAAGVAHEINNPLNIISGYAELTSKRLESGRGPFDETVAAQARENLKVIREEAFRCKEITEKLLSLSRNGSEGREELNLANVARDVATMTKGLKNYRDRRITLKFDLDQPLAVRANLTEMKQVLLNLTINALEASPPQSGEVCIEGRQNEGWVELCVKDNGRGMGPEVLRHVFEPFFTARHRSSDRGTGLGLSITHAIIENHQGRIVAASDGPGCGAQFTVRLPAAVNRG